nr:MAG TPA_asm: hypothetical protein [Bacteriophage sp.]
MLYLSIIHFFLSILFLLVLLLLLSLYSSTIVV